MKKAKPAPQFNSNSMQRVIDELCVERFTTKPTSTDSRIYLYRTKLNMTSNEVGKLFSIHPKVVGTIVFNIGADKPKELEELEKAISDCYPKYLRTQYANHAAKVVERVNNYSTFTTRCSHSRTGIVPGAILCV
jgi:hypothetical protein